jgi:hypothetical protein
VTSDLVATVSITEVVPTPEKEEGEDPDHETYLGGDAHRNALD